jgi:hypothetical protein
VCLMCVYVPACKTHVYACVCMWVCVQGDLGELIVPFLHRSQWRLVHLMPCARCKDGGSGGLVRLGARLAIAPKSAHPHRSSLCHPQRQGGPYDGYWVTESVICDSADWNTIITSW